MRGNRKVDVTDPAKSKHVEMMAEQALKVLDQLAKLPGASKKKHRNVKETSRIAKCKLEGLKESGIDLRKFYSQYDTQRTGKISYEEFNSSLLHVASGIAKEEAQDLASSLDHKKIGSVEYRNILDSLQELEKTAPADKGADPDGPTTTSAQNATVEEGRYGVSDGSYLQHYSSRSTAAAGAAAAANNKATTYSDENDNDGFAAAVKDFRDSTYDVEYDGGVYSGYNPQVSNYSSSDSKWEAQNIGAQYESKHGSGGYSQQYSAAPAGQPLPSTDVVSIVYLDPHRKSDVPSAADSLDDDQRQLAADVLRRDPDFPRSGRRLFKQNVSTVLSGLDSKGPPYYVEPPPELIKEFKRIKAAVVGSDGIAESKASDADGKIQRDARSRSAPPRFRPNSSSGAAGGVKPMQKDSLRTALLIEVSG